MMTILFSILLVIATAQLTETATTMMPMMTTHPEKTEYESFQFQFDGTTGMLAVRSMHNCYIWQLTDKEHQQVHTDDGIRNIELRVLKEIDNAYYTVVPKGILHPAILNACTRYSSHFYLVH
ncbi:uncharacterized protein LOC132757825 [Ruditapes philippinarum]|uniref:uncharacterized protein LOC132757825 n=1 Tax=Ruditapes philippinarum TaxID=129788 RepID=UPI00295A5F9C|nr:uncharacterized protein LOC132757825 [Ruditapes philippinarum]